MKTTGAAFNKNAIESASRIAAASFGLNGRSSERAFFDKVAVKIEELSMPTYLPAPPDKNPMFLEKRVYQGSTGKIYPLPFTDRIAELPVDRKWKAIWIENEFLRVLILPEIGGRIHAIQDKTNGYDLIYNQVVIKPALVGLAGPWISGGIEFNWPQHHRPATFLPVDFEVEKHEDGSVTVWCSDHDPICRMKGMHGACLHPGKSYLELKVRAYNRTPHIQTFLWWANVATRVHEAYKSFFPPDVYYVADHARRTMSEYPLSKGHYYGIDYAARGSKGIPKSEVPNQFLPPHCSNGKTAKSVAGMPNYAANDLSFYANIPTPCSYMSMGSEGNFFGGYDYRAQAGIVHVANHHISPGKKQWTWGNHEFGYAWDRNLTDIDGNGKYDPYIEIMAGVFTDNQPDFSFLRPGETRTWRQFWYPIQKTGPVQQANIEAAISILFSEGQLQIGVAVTQERPNARIVIVAKGKKIAEFRRKLSPAQPFVETVRIAKSIAETDLLTQVLDEQGVELVSYRAKTIVKKPIPPAATEPAQASEIASNDELYITGLHLDQYRHATRSPVAYWREAIKRDPLDSRCNNAIGLWHLKRGEFDLAENCFRNALKRLTSRNANPADGEPHYNLGLCLRQLGRLDEAYSALYKAVWNQAWVSAGCHALAEIDCIKRDWVAALEHLDNSLRFGTDNLGARNLKVMVFRKHGKSHEADLLLNETLALDPLDWWARHLNGNQMGCDLQTLLDIAHDYARAGFYAEAIELLSKGCAKECDLPDQSWGAKPLVSYTLGWLAGLAGDKVASKKYFKQATGVKPDYCFPARIEEIAILKAAMLANPKDARAPYYLGNLYYHLQRHDEAIGLWELSAKLDARFSVVWRNLGMGYLNIRRNPATAKLAYEQAFRANLSDARLLYERDQLWKRLGEAPAKRLRELEKYPQLTAQRDDLSVEFCAMLNQNGRPLEAMQLLEKRKFQPWEGGEGGPLGQHVRSRLALGRVALAKADYQGALAYFQSAMTAPRNLGEARHLLANQSDVLFFLGCAAEGLGDKLSAKEHWLAAANFKGDFQQMSVRVFSEMTYYSALAWRKLGKNHQAMKLFTQLLAYGGKLLKAEAKIDYFATSLPTMLLFEDDLKFRQETMALFLQSQALLGLGMKAKGCALLKSVLKRDPSHPLAQDLLTETITS